MLRLQIELEGEIIRRTKPIIGYLHTGMEKTGEQLTFSQGGTNVTRMDYLAPFHNELAFSLAVEKMLGIEVPERAAAIRVLLTELNRCSSHLVALATNGMDIGAISMMIYGFREREQILRFFEKVTGLRMNHNFIRPGVRPLGYRSPAWDLTPLTLDLVREAGMLYSSNLMDDEWPYLHRHPGGDVVELPVQWSRDDAPYFMFNPHYVNRPIASPTLVLSEWQEELLGVVEWGGLFNLTMHPQIIGHPARLRMLRRLIEVIKGLAGTDVWLATCEEVARHWLESERR